jgi:hypothetical protein
MKLWPSKSQWKRWSMVSRFSLIGTYLAAVGIALGILALAVPYLGRQSPVVRIEEKVFPPADLRESLEERVNRLASSNPSPEMARLAALIPDTSMHRGYAQLPYRRSSVRPDASWARFSPRSSLPGQPPLPSFVTRNSSLVAPFRASAIPFPSFHSPLSAFHYP